MAALASARIVPTAASAKKTRNGPQQRELRVCIPDYYAYGLSIRMELPSN
jgi:hypothetical protein